MTDFLTADTNLPSYMMFPRFLLDMKINETAKMLYIILLDRVRLSLIQTENCLVIRKR